MKRKVTGALLLANLASNHHHRTSISPPLSLSLSLRLPITSLQLSRQAQEGAASGVEGDWYAKEQLARRVGEALERLDASANAEFDSSAEVLKRVQVSRRAEWGGTSNKER